MVLESQAVRILHPLCRNQSQPRPVRPLRLPGALGGRLPLSKPCHTPSSPLLPHSLESLLCQGIGYYKQLTSGAEVRVLMVELQAKEQFILQ